MQLLEKVPYDFEKQKISLSNAAYFYMVNHPKDFWGNFFSIAEKITFGTDIIDRCIALKENIETYAKIIRKMKNPMSRNSSIALA